MPVATTENVSVPPAVVDWDAGPVTIVGATGVTMRAAAVLVAVLVEAVVVQKQK